MARIPCADENKDPEIVALADQISAERGGRVPTAVIAAYNMVSRFLLTPG